MCSYKILLFGDDAYLTGALILLNMLDESKRTPTQSKNSPCIMFSAVIIKYYCYYVREMSGLYCVLRHGNTVICYLYHFKTNPHQCFSKYYSNFMRFNFFYNLLYFCALLSSGDLDLGIIYPFICTHHWIQFFPSPLVWARILQVCVCSQFVIRFLSYQFLSE